MTKNKPTVTIGIPAYNEEANIASLLKSLVSQKQIGFHLKKIVVISDGSSDETVKNACSVKSKIIYVVNSKERLGQAARQNELTKLNSSDFFVLLNGDILIRDPLFISKLIEPFEDKSVGLVGAKTAPLKPSNKLETLLYLGEQYKNKLFKSIQGGNNSFLCHGRARAFSKEFAKVMKWPKLINEDSYSYFSCIYNKFKFVYQDKAEILYKLPDTFEDHRRQSYRFWYAEKELEKYFPKSLVSSNLKLQFKKVISELSSYVINYPLSTLLYALLVISTRIVNLTKKENPAWKISKSTKTKLS